VSSSQAPPRLVLATTNRHKVAEVTRILTTTGVDVALDAAPGIDVVETGATFAENALLKASVVAAATGEVAVADDSGICVDALNGMPGVLSARWAGRQRDDAANLRLLLDQVADVPDERRGAQFVCAAAVAAPDGRSEVVVAEVVGSLAHEPRGSGGFGYDPVFLPDGYSETTAQLSPERKDAISHRGRAFRLLADQLPAFLAAGRTAPAG
jgi:XTP/dITP diphosphohydrolase